MRKLAWVAGLLTLTALPASAATERIQLRYASAAELEQWLIGAQMPRRIGQGGGLGGRPMVAEGITLITAKTTPNELVVDGTAEGLAKIREIVRLVDIPPRTIRTHFRVFPREAVPLDPKLFAGNIEVDLKAPGIADRTGTQVAGHLSEKQVSALLKNAPKPLVEGRLESDNNRLVRVFWSAAPEKNDRSAVTIVPRVNGNGTITAFVTAGFQQYPPPDTESIVVRTAEGSPFVVGILPKAGVVVVAQIEAVPVPQAKIKVERKTAAAPRR